MTLRKHVGEFFVKCVDWFPHVTHVDCHICDARATDGGMTRVPQQARAQVVGSAGRGFFRGRPRPRLTPAGAGAFGAFAGAFGAFGGMPAARRFAAFVEPPAAPHFLTLA